MPVGEVGLNLSKNVRFFFDNIRVDKAVEDEFGNVKLDNGKGRDFTRLDINGNG